MFRTKQLRCLCTFQAILLSSQLRSHLTLHLSLPPPRRWRRADLLGVHFATWRPTASPGQPIRGCEKQTRALLLVHRSQELIPLSMAMSLCRLAALKPIIHPPPVLLCSDFFSPADPFTHTHTSAVCTRETEGDWESQDLRAIAMRGFY